MLVSRPTGPLPSLIRMMRSIEYLTSSAVSSSPLAKVSPSRSLQLYRSFPASVKEQLSAASGTGSPPPRGRVTRVWMVWRSTFQAPAS